MAEPTVITTCEEMSTLARSWRLEGLSHAVVPTMGALHDGHIALIREAARRADRVVVTIFVNPTQFDRAADLESYPRDLAADLARSANESVDAVFVPTVDEIYPNGPSADIDPGPVAESLEGTYRPGHFEGVATVVVRLLDVVAPTIALFGEKDAQQLAVIRSVCGQHTPEVEIVGMPTIREPDGLALSSRNAHLDPESRGAATAIHRALLEMTRAWSTGRAETNRLSSIGSEIIAEAGGDCDYVAIVDPETFTTADTASGGDLIVTAAWFGGVRLLDALPLGAAT